MKFEELQAQLTEAEGYNNSGNYDEAVRCATELIEVLKNERISVNVHR
ncbi:MAG: hypothetical protein IPM69_16035 [Ignavibacteria bacterium]|nr:hypothetical protein [Ignavibacteria bacterium]